SEVIIMLSIIWSSLLVVSVIFAVTTGKGDEIVTMLNSSIQSGASLFITIAPLMCFWPGIMETADRANVTNFLAKLLSPLTRRLFPEAKEDADALSRISMNMSANILGMGNAATPLGLRAMEKLDEINDEPTRASRAMCMFVVVNTASIQLIPTTVISLRSELGSATPGDILPAVWLTTAAAFFVGIVSAKICQRRI
ncbi:MAG: spore maturation protein A, partial [Clostridia bacterium]|nr:spore maturation protein A [Clostridia bacterium]